MSEFQILLTLKAKEHLSVEWQEDGHTFVSLPNNTIQVDKMTYSKQQWFAF